jgi:autotransporter-associated beta strand protein
LVNESVGGIYTLSQDDGTLQASTLTGSSDWGLPTDAFVRVEENSTLRKEGTNTISWHGNRLYIDGLVRLMGGAGNQGTLWISNATDVAGSGQFRLDAGSHLKLGQTSAPQGSDLTYDVQLRGGKISAEGQSAQLSGGLTLYETTEIDVTGELDHLGITGNFLANPGGRVTGIRKTGLGLLTLSGTNAFTGNIRLLEGKIAIDGTTQAAQVVVDAGATLQGVGVIESDVQVSGIVAPGNSIGTLTTDSLALMDGSTLSMEIGSTSSFDQLVVIGEFSVDPGATLQILLGDGFEPTIGDEFQLFTFGSFSGQFSNFNVPELQSGHWDFSQLGSSGTVLVAVPEPQNAALCLTLLMLVVLACTTRHRCHLVQHR